MTFTPRPPTRWAVRDESDVVMARHTARSFALAAGVPEKRVEALVLAVSEIARNLVVHAGSGELTFCEVRRAASFGVEVTARDEGPGIPDVELALTDGYSTGAGLGFGLSSARRLVDEFELESTDGAGTRVTLRVWGGVGTAP